MLVPHDQQTRKPASTVSPHLEQVQGWVADIAEGTDSVSRDLGAEASSEAEVMTSVAGASSRSGSGTGIDAV
jgi:hypothetical protein